MDENMLTAKTCIVTFFTAIGTFLGWKGIMMLAWVALMALDYLSGTIAAGVNGKWSSSVAREGLRRKVGMILAVTVVAIADVVMMIIAE